jgi:hypothetical protein
MQHVMCFSRYQLKGNNHYEIFKNELLEPAVTHFKFINEEQQLSSNAGN